MNDCNVLYSDIDRVENQIASLKIQMERAGISTVGDLQNDLDRALSNLNYYQNKLNQCLKAKTPDELKIFLYVIVSTKEKVYQNLANHSCYFEDDRYDETEYRKWKPFKGQATIDELLGFIINQYQIQPIYLDEDIDDVYWANLDDEITNSVAIIDLFSITSKNKLIACKFDTQKAGVILPLCITLSEELRDYATSTRNDFKTLKSKTTLYIPCDWYSFDIATVDSFKLQLTNVFRRKFPIKNQSVVNSLVRDIPFTLQ